ncbi:MAG: DNA repair protein RadC [Tissierellia bacterium]|nr:DNA repair protein RadC [Tissierellia bacterium]
MDDKKINIKDLDVCDRPMEKLVSSGVKNLTNYDLLAILIGSGNREQNALDLAKTILNEKFRKSQLLFASIEELMSVKGIGLSKATRILAGLELGRRLGMVNTYDRISYNSPDSVAEYFYHHYKHSSNEEFVILILDSKNKLIDLDTVSIGTINSTIVHPREVFKNAIKKSANSIILVHNHPSGDPRPSDEDIKISKRLIEVGNIIGIKVLDHIIVGANRHVSLREENII